MSAPAVPLLVTDDATLVADLRRLAAAAGTALDVSADPLEARGRWPSAAVVLVGHDLLPALVIAAPGRRDGVHVVAREPSPDGMFRAALALGAESVVELPAAEGWLVEVLSDTADGANGRAGLVCVVGGCGGAGATTFAAALATAAARDASPAEVRPVTLLDADPLGPGIERVGGLEDAVGATWGPLLESAGRLGSRSLRAALPQRNRLAVLGWGRGARVALEPQVVREVVSAAQRGSSLVVADLPRYLDPAVEELLRRCDHLVVVTTLTSPAVASAAQLVAQVLPVVPRAHLVARGPVSALDAEEVAQALGMPLAAAMTDQRRLSESVELGLGPLQSRRGPLARAARETLARVAAPSLPAAGAAQ